MSAYWSALPCGVLWQFTSEVSLLEPMLNRSTGSSVLKRFLVEASAGFPTQCWRACVIYSDMLSTVSAWITFHSYGSQFRDLVKCGLAACSGSMSTITHASVQQRTVITTAVIIVISGVEVVAIIVWIFLFVPSSVSAYAKIAHTNLVVIELVDIRFILLVC